MLDRHDDSIAALRSRQQVLVNRLTDGDRRIAEAQAQGTDTTAWESFWLQLLDEYEQVSNRLDDELLERYESAA
jgi:hypothetical protein